jgi:hypothetical protein
MSRPRLDAEQKKVSFSLAFSPNLIAALEKVRSTKSQSVFVEEWLRQHPQIAEEFWMQERSTQGHRTARGESLEAVRPRIREYAHYYSQVIFQEMAKGEPKLLKQRFGSLVRGCEAVYQKHVHTSELGE